MQAVRILRNKGVIRRKLRHCNKDIDSADKITLNTGVEPGYEPFESQLAETVESLREYTGWGNFNIDFGRDEETNSLVIKIIDRDTGETLRQIPPDQLLNLKMHMQEVLGLVFDHMA